jgi:uncharacterized membrane protein
VSGILALIGLALLLGVPVMAIVAMARTSELRRRVESLERRLEVLRRASAEAPAASSLPAPAAAAAPSATYEKHAAAAPSRQTSIAKPRAPVSATAREPDWIEAGLQRVWSWFTDGNVPVKVGMVVLFAGVGALLKYAADQGWMSFPIEARLAGIAVVALGGFAFGWRQRETRRTFALSVQGGAIGVLLMTAFAAFKLYGLVGPAPAFASWVILAGAAGLLALWQEARALAVLGILAGFMAPILMSTGAGNHVVLFTFYAVLNAAIFGIAWLRSWRELNLLGFVFTFGIGTVWGVLRYRPEQFASTLPFLLLFFAFYLLLPILHARRGDGSRRDPVDACLVFGAPLVSFLHLAALLEGARLPLAGCAVGATALYAMLAWVLGNDRAPLLRQAHGVLSVGFATLAVPLAFSAQTTASVFALEGAAMVWLGLAQSRRLPVLAGGVLQLLAAVCYWRGLAGVEFAVAIVNAGFMGALLLAVAGFASAWSYYRAGQRDQALGYYLWALAWWLVMGLREIARFTPQDSAPDAQLAFAALTAVMAALALRREKADALAWTAALGMAAALPLALSQSIHHEHPFAGYGVLAWGAYALAGTFTLLQMRTLPGSAAAGSSGAWLIAWPLALCLYLGWAAQEAQLASGWRLAAIVLPWLAVGAGLQWRPDWAGWPLQRYIGEWRGALLTLWQVILAMFAAWLLLAPGDAAPLPWLPLLNPVELALLGVLALFAEWTSSAVAPPAVGAQRARLLTIAVFLLATSCTLRAVHQLGGVPWDSGMFGTALAQASLSLVWSVLGVAGWIAGSRRRQRELWRAGAVLMGVVLVKLVIIDRLHLGNLSGIASFVGYGLLCTVVGYLAPAPPRASEA